MSDLKATRGSDNTIIYTSDKNPGVQMTLHCISEETFKKLKEVENKIIQDILKTSKDFSK